MQTREELELRKLQLEIANLGTPQIKTPAFWISVASVVLVSVGVVGQNYLSNIQAAQAKLDMTEAQRARDMAKADTEALLKQRDTLRTEKDRLTARNEQLVAANLQLDAERRNREAKLALLLDAARATPAVAQSKQLATAAAAASNSLFSVGIYGFGVDASKLQQATEALTGDGYTIIASDMLTVRPPWLAPQATVLFYSADSSDKARDIARQLESVTGLKFNVTRGAGAGIPRGQERTNIRVHLV
ncbi:hypothetical protein G3N57_01805 [Paraburkholderia sp. Se-20369]|nr:hypothetical protein [Paraburkholderia sp. Se-20369]